MDPIYLKDTTICIKSRERKMFYNFFNRFYTPFVFIIWFIVGLDINTCQNVPILIIIISCTAAFFNAMDTFTQWKNDLCIVLESNSPPVNEWYYSFVFLSEYAIHWICIILSIWWVDDLHSCMSLDRNYQFYLWCGVLIVVIVLHVLQHKLRNKQIQMIVKQSYTHVSSDTV